MNRVSRCLNRLHLQCLTKCWKNSTKLSLRKANNQKWHTRVQMNLLDQRFLVASVCIYECWCSNGMETSYSGREKKQKSAQHYRNSVFTMYIRLIYDTDVRLGIWNDYRKITSMAWIIRSFILSPLCAFFWSCIKVAFKPIPEQWINVLRFFLSRTNHVDSSLDTLDLLHSSYSSQCHSLLPIRFGCALDPTSLICLSLTREASLE